MEKLIRTEKTSHYYYPDGTPCFEIAKKDGSGMRNITVTDAKKLGLLPSVTTVLGLLAKPALENWKQEQAVLASLTLPRLDNEAEDDFAKRVVIDMQETSKKAMEFGTAIHEAIESFLLGEAVPAELQDYVSPAIKWLQNNIDFAKEIKPEIRLANIELGFAGTTDLWGTLLDGRTCLIDHKTQGTKEKYNHKINFYDEWCWQLSAYAMIKSVDCIINLGVSTSRVGVVEAKEWTADEVMKGMAVFSTARQLFKIIKGV